MGFQWRSHGGWGSRGAECHPRQRKICQNREKRWKKSGKIGKKGTNRGGSLILPLLSDRAGCATVGFTASFSSGPQLYESWNEFPIDLMYKDVSSLDTKWRRPWAKI